MEWSRRVEYHIFLIYQKLTVQDFNFQLFGILRGSTLRFDGSPLLYLIFYSNLSGRGVMSEGALAWVLGVPWHPRIFEICIWHPLNLAVGVH